MATCPWIHRYTQPHTIKPPRAGVQLVGHTSIIFSVGISKDNMLLKDNTTVKKTTAERKIHTLHKIKVMIEKNHLDACYNDVL